MRNNISHSHTTIYNILRETRDVTQQYALSFLLLYNYITVDYKVGRSAEEVVPSGKDFILNYEINSYLHGFCIFITT